MWDLIVSVPDHCLSFYYAGSRWGGGGGADVHAHLKISYKAFIGTSYVISQHFFRK